MPQYLHPYLPWLLASLAVLLLAWLTWRRPNRQRLGWRLLASVVAGISLVLLVFPPTRQQAIRPSSAILLTEGYDADTLEALLNNTEARTEVYAYKLHQEGAPAVPDLATWKQEQPGLQTVHLLGYGLEEHELGTLENISVVPHLSPLSTGVTAVRWPEHMRLGEALVVTGKYKNATEVDAWLYLQAAGSLQDSALIKADTTQAFALHYTPKQEGRFTYTLLRKTGEKQDTLGQIPLQVAPLQKLNTLLLAAAPSFEFKFLKNHLGELQHGVALRTQVSKGISQSEWVNMPKQNLGRVTPRLLQAFDVVITEPQALQDLSSAERVALERAVREEGLGVLTLANEPGNSPHTAFFTAFEGKRLSQGPRSVQASWDGITTTLTTGPYALTGIKSTTGLVEESGENLLAVLRQESWGKVALSVVPETFPWQLEGKEEVYAGYWANLLSAVAKLSVQEKFWRVGDPQMPQAGRPMQLFYTDYTAKTNTTAPTATVSALNGSTRNRLALAQSLTQPEQFSATYWPQHSGWYSVQASDSAPFYFFVQDTSAWPFENRLARRQAVQHYAARQKMDSTPDTPVAFEEEPVSVLWFFALFVLSSSFLWLEEKF